MMTTPLRLQLVPTVVEGALNAPSSYLDMTFEANDALIMWVMRLIY